jgi:hypothetical protein
MNMWCRTQLKAHAVRARTRISAFEHASFSDSTRRSFAQNIPRFNLKNFSLLAVNKRIVQQDSRRPKDEGKWQDRVLGLNAPFGMGGARSFKFLTKEAATESSDYPTDKRWTAIPPANVVHLSIGAVYAYSMWTPSLGTALGVVSAAANDWTQSELIPVFSVAALTLGITTNTLGKWVEEVGPRKSGVIGSFFWGSGLCVAGLGAELHSLPLVYAGYGLLGGVG